QSQASVYEIVERFDPEMLEEIKKRVREGRWEITASTWVETDKNMVNGEGLARHILYTKDYLSGLFGLPKDYFCLDFEPDTFGHNANVPEILAKGGVKYYYHCRGKILPEIYRWKAPSGEKILVYREPFWYNAEIHATELSIYPKYLKKYGLNKLIKVYGVGDHGGGPTRRDLNRIRDFMSWPLMPNLKFSTYREFFEYIDANAKNVPEIDGELNCVFTGCYTSQSRIKAANRYGERLLDDTEKLLAFAPAVKADLKDAWRIHLFNHFHDILPGSGVRDTREYALGKAQERNAIVGAAKTRALLDMARRVDKSFVKYTDDPEDTSMGAGVGFGAGNGVFAGNMSYGSTRAFFVVNNSPVVKEYATLTVWDYDFPKEQYRFTDASGKELRHEAVTPSPVYYNAHAYMTVLVKVDLEPYSYTSVVLTPTGKGRLPEHGYQQLFTDPFFRQHLPKTYVLENSVVRAEFSPMNAALVRFTDKRNGRVIGDGANPVATLRYVLEDSCKGMNSWIVGQTVSDTPLTTDVRINQDTYKPDGVLKRFGYKVPFGSSDATVEITLTGEEDVLKYSINVGFREYGSDKEVPALDFAVVSDDAEKYLYDNAFGVVEREAYDEDTPGLSFVFNGDEKGGLMLGSDSKYGFRCNGGLMRMKLIRATAEPDKYPESYEHSVKVYLSLADTATPSELIAKSAGFCIDCDSVTMGAESGNLAPAGKFFRLEGDVVLSTVKRSEKDKARIFRVYETNGNNVECSLKVDGLRDAFLVNINEEPIRSLKVTDGTAYFDVRPYSVVTVKTF
ncbi:MAG: glycoside hydrolase family 38 C-terminal domain-containing protein, partial [Christensenellales bacterium]